MTDVLIPLSSSTAVKRVNPDGGHSYTVNLEPALHVPVGSGAKVYLHNFTCTNSFANVHKRLYDNADLVIKYVHEGETVTKTFTVPDGAYTVERLEQVINQLFWTESGATQEGGADQLSTNFTDTDSFVRVAHASRLEPRFGAGTHFADPFLESGGPSDGLYSWPQAASQETMLAGKRAGTTRKYKLLSIEADFTRNRIALMACLPLEVGGSLVEKLLGFKDAIATPVELDDPVVLYQTTFTNQVFADTAADFDSARSIAFHCPQLCGHGYALEGGPSAGTLATVPINVKPGSVLSWESSVPIYLKCTAEGSRGISALQFFLSNEKGQPVDELEDSFEAVVVINMDPAKP